jgi:hypothetical protein
LVCASARILIFNARPPAPFTPYSERKLLTGFTTAALIAWKLTVNNAIANASRPARANIHQFSGTR